MKITREADYALRIVAMLSKESKQIEAKQIAERCAIPYRFTLKILRKLVQSKITKSFRGVNGGYMLNKSGADINFREIIEAIDGPISINQCICSPGICTNVGTCKIQKQLLNIRDILQQELEKITFDMVIDM